VLERVDSRGCMAECYGGQGVAHAGGGRLKQRWNTPYLDAETAQLGLLVTVVFVLQVSFIY
jgi:hypothetical protein